MLYSISGILTSLSLSGKISLNGGTKNWIKICGAASAYLLRKSFHEQLRRSDFGGGFWGGFNEVRSTIIKGPQKKCRPRAWTGTDLIRGGVIDCRIC